MVIGERVAGAQIAGIAESPLAFHTWSMSGFSSFSQVRDKGLRPPRILAPNAFGLI